MGRSDGWIVDKDVMLIWNVSSVVEWWEDEKVGSCEGSWENGDGDCNGEKLGFCGSSCERDQVA